MTFPSNDNRKSAKPAAAKDGGCPVCGAPAGPPALSSASGADKSYAPFCSKRCADVDLHRWLTGGYAIPAAEDDSEGAAADERED